MIGAVDMGQKWGWYNAFWVLSGESFTNMKDVPKRNFRETLTALAYLKDKRHEANA